MKTVVIATIVLSWFIKCGWLKGVMWSGGVSEAGASMAVMPRRLRAEARFWAVTQKRRRTPDHIPPRANRIQLIEIMWSFIEKQRQILAQEQGAVVKDWGGKTSIALVYPNTYYVGMSNLAVHTLYHLLNTDPRIVCERAFLPEPKDVAELKRTKSPIVSIENQRPLSEFDVVAFSISFQNDFLNIIPILSLCSIPHRRKHRNDDDPLLLAGGCAVTLNPHPLSEIFDALAIGEYEVMAPEVIAAICEGEGRSPTVEALSRIEGIYTPDHPHAKIKRRFASHLEEWPTQTVIYTPHTEFKNMHLIEMSRGCPRRCKFCATPHLYSPYRFRNLSSILKMTEPGMKNRRRIGLIGADLLNQRAFLDTARVLSEHDVNFSPSSVRVDSVNEEVARLMAQAGHKSISLGVEAATDRLRTQLGKSFSNEKILKAVTILAQEGILNLRLYFMIGLPGETDKDIKAIAELTLKIQNTLRKAAAKKARASSITLTVTPFVPKPLTHYEREPFAGEKYLKDAVKTLKRLLGKAKGVRLHVESITSSMSDALLSRGNSNMINFLERYYETNSVRQALTALSDEDRLHLSEGFKKGEPLPWS